MFGPRCLQNYLLLLACEQHSKFWQIQKTINFQNRSLFCVHTTVKILPNPKTMKNLPNLNDTNSQFNLTLLIPFFETLVFIKCASFTLFLHVEGTRHRNKVHDFYLREYGQEGIQRVITGVRLFSNGDVLPFTWLRKWTLKCVKVQIHFAPKALPGTASRKCIHFCFRMFSEVGIFPVFVKKLTCCECVHEIFAKSSIFRTPKMVAIGRNFPRVLLEQC